MSVQLLFAASICLILCSNACKFATTGKKNPHLDSLPNRTLAMIPNPLENPMACGRPKGTVTLVCDMDRVLEQVESDDLDHSIIDTLIETGVNTAVVVVNKVNSTGYEDDEDAVEHFASALHAQYGLGESLGLLIFMAVQEKIIYFKKGDVLAKVFNARKEEELMIAIDSRLKRVLYGEALDQAVILLRNVLESPRTKRLFYEEGNPIMIEKMKERVFKRIETMDECVHSTCYNATATTTSTDKPADADSTIEQDTGIDVTVSASAARVETEL